MRQKIKVLLGVVAVAMLFLSASVALADVDNAIPTKIKFKKGSFWFSYTEFENKGGDDWDLCASEQNYVDGIRFEAKFDEEDEQPSWWWRDIGSGSWIYMNDDGGTWGLCPWGWQCIWKSEEDTLEDEDFEDGEFVTIVLHDADPIIITLEDAC